MGFISNNPKTSMRRTFKPYKSCIFMGIRYSYAIGVGWVHTNTLKPLRPDDFVSMREYNKFINELEFQAVQDSITIKIKSSNQS